MNLNGKAYKLIEGISKRVSSVEFDCIKVLDFGVEKLLDESTAWELAVAVAEASLGGLGKVRIKKGFLEVAVEENPAVA